MQRGCQVGESWDESAGNALAAIRAASGAAAGESTLARVEWLVADLAATRVALADECRRRDAAEDRLAELEAALQAERDANAARGRVLPGSVVRVELESLPPVTHALPVGSDPAFDGTFPAPGGGRSAGRVTQGEGA
jgi:hypothetical protein